MLSTLIGIILGWISQLVFVGYALIESAVLTIAFNYLAPILPEYGVNLPFEHVKYGHVFALTVLINIFGFWINRLTPKIIKIESKDKDSNDKQDI